MNMQEYCKWVAKINGVELREASIRVKFTYQGKQVRETLTLNGKPLALAPANIKYAARLVADIKKQIQYGAFDYAATFPDSKRTASNWSERRRALLCLDRSLACTTGSEKVNQG